MTKQNIIIPNLGRQVDRGILKIDPRQKLAGMTRKEDGLVVETSRWDVFRVTHIRRPREYRYSIHLQHQPEMNIFLEGIFRLRFASPDYGLVARAPRPPIHTVW